MTTKPNLLLLVLGFTLMYDLPINVSQAEVRDNSPSAPEVQDSSVVDTTSHLKSAKQAWIKPRQIRCWQRGRLIVEENDWYLKKIGEQVSFTRKEDQTLYMFNFNDTFCIYRKSEGLQ